MAAYIRKCNINLQWVIFLYLHTPTAPVMVSDNGSVSETDLQYSREWA
jgi:hypothetical protein